MGHKNFPSVPRGCTLHRLRTGEEKNLQGQPADRGSPETRPVNWCACACVWYKDIASTLAHWRFYDALCKSTFYLLSYFEYIVAVICRSKTEGVWECLWRPARRTQFQWQEGTEDDERAAYEYGRQGHGSWSAEGAPNVHYTKWY